MQQSQEQQKEITITDVRDKYANEIRKQDRDKIIQQKRQISQQSQQQLIPTTLPEDQREQIMLKLTELEITEYHADDIKLIILKITSPQPLDQLWCVGALRRMVSVEVNAPIKQVINSNVVPQVIQIIEKSNIPVIILQGLWFLSNLTSGNKEDLEYLFKVNVFDILIKYLSHPILLVKEQVICGLCNFSIESVEYQNLLLQRGVAKPIQFLATQITNLQSLEYCTNLIRSLSKNKNQIYSQHLKGFIDVACQLLKQHNEMSIVVNCCFTLANLILNANDETQQAVVDQGVIPKLFALLNKKQLQYLLPSLMVVTNLLAGNEKICQYILDQNYLTLATSLIDNQYLNIRKEICWSLCNLSAGNTVFIEQIMVHSSLVDKLMIINVNEQGDVGEEAARVLNNIIQYGTQNQINCLISKGIFEKYAMALKTKNIEQLKIVVLSLLKLFEYGNSNKQLKSYIQSFSNAGGISKMSSLMWHQDEQIRQYAQILFSQFLGDIEWE